MGALLSPESARRALILAFSSGLGLACGEAPSDAFEPGRSLGSSFPGEMGALDTNPAIDSTEGSMPTSDPSMTRDELRSASLARPLFLDDRYVLEQSGLRMVVDPAAGGRIVEFALNGRQVLTGPEVVAAGDENLQNMYGSTFWTSPQSDWGWPPERAVDQAPYAASTGEGSLVLEGEPGATTGYSVRKRFALDGRAGMATVEYGMVNRAASRAAAPWEISRVPKRGLSFFPAAGEPTADSSLQSTQRDAVAWVDIAAAPSGDSKLFQDGAEGWLAHAFDGVVLIKTFENIPRGEQAPGEAEIEIFISGDYGYVELEQQGRYVLPAAGEELRWRVGWWLREIPADMAVAVGSEALVQLVRDTIGR